jgi:hypothetical protein
LRRKKGKCSGNKYEAARIGIVLLYVGMTI